MKRIIIIVASVAVIVSAISLPLKINNNAQNTNNQNGGGSGILPYNSGIQGQIMLGPQCPVMRDPPDPACADKPYQTTVAVYRGNVTATSPFAFIATEKDGRYKFALPPGEYTVTARTPDNQIMPRCTPETVTVEPRGFKTVNLSCDTGIR